MKYLKRILFIFLIISGSIFSQNEDLQIGTSLSQLKQNQGAYYDYSDPEAVNIKVSIWGFVKYPGRYVVPYYTNVNDLLSFSGGPTQDSNMDEMKIIRTTVDSSQIVIEVDYKDLLWMENIKEVNKSPKMLAGDVLIVPGEPRLFFRDYLSIGLSIFSVLISLSILVLNIVK
jgi:protein involved in polysaccharide export with SLBB domain